MFYRRFPRSVSEYSYRARQYRSVAAASRATRAASTGDSETHFGFRQVPREEKESLVGGVFSRVASSYDLMNDLMSFGLHRYWKREFVSMLRPQQGIHHLDVAGGTGDIALAIRAFAEIGAKRGRSAQKNRIVVCDINANMLEEGKKRPESAPSPHTDMEWLQGNAEQIPFDDNSFDSYTVAFGIRNVTNIDKALAEAHRVLRPGGRFLCLEFSKVDNPLLSTLYDVYSFNVIPVMGQIVARDYDSYQYLVESIRKHPSQDEFLSLMREARLQACTYTNMTDGIVAVHSGFKF